jgi:hypothetical protein
VHILLTAIRWSLILKLIYHQGVETVLRADTPLLAAVHPQVQEALVAACRRGFEGWGTPGTQPLHTVELFRVLAVLMQIAAVLYCIWRPLRSLGEGWEVLLSVPFWLAEVLTLVVASSIWVMSLWYAVDRPRRDLSDMIEPGQFPTVDVFVVCMSEPLEVRGVSGGMALSGAGAAGHVCGVHVRAAPGGAWGV